jgi:transposase-like protein
MNKRRTYSWDFKAEVLAVYQVDGPASAAREYGISRDCVQRWARAAGLSTSAETKKQTEAALDSLAARRLRIRDKLAEYAEKTLDRLGEDFTFATKDGIIITLDGPPPGACKDLCTAAAILIDKLRLEAGEATTRGEVVHDYAKLSDAELIEEAERILSDAARTQ